MSNDNQGANAMNFKDFDLIVINTSGGKDSQTLLRKVVLEARAAGVVDRLVAVHAELEEEWDGTKELVGEQCAAYGVRVEYVKRPQGSLLDQIEKRGLWPSNKQRYCTSDHKRGQVNKVIVAESNRLGLEHVRVLNCLGIRAEESTARAKKSPVEINKRLSNSKRTVTDFFAIFDWTVEQVWDDIKASGVRYHRAYDLGMPRLSCCFCVFAGRDALLLAGHHNPELLDRYVQVERKIGHTFRKELPIVEIQAAVQAGEQPRQIATWSM